MKSDKANQIFDQIALETKDKNLMRLAIERKKSQALKENTFQRQNLDLEIQ